MQAKLDLNHGFSRGDTSVLVNKPADSIKEAIEKYKDVAGQFV